MNEILSWLGWAAVGLLAAAVVVAGWEHLVREARGQRMDCGAQPGSRPGTPIDLPLDTASAAWLQETTAPPPPAPHPAPLTEAAARLAAMTQALARAAHPGRASHDGGRWMDTTPRIVGLAEPALGHREGRQRTSRQGHAEDAANGPPSLPAPPDVAATPRQHARDRGAQG